MKQAMPAMLTTWWLWVLFGLAAYGAVISDRRVNWEGESPRMERKDGVIFVVLLLTTIPSLVFGATFPRGSSLVWPLAAFVVVLAAFGLRMKATGVLGPWFSGRLTIQPGQVALDDGPYRVIRHPGYLGVGLYLVGLTASFALWGSSE